MLRSFNKVSHSREKKDRATVEQQQTWRFDDFDNGPDEGIDKRFFIRVACPFMISTSGEGMQKEVSHFIYSPSQYTVRGVRVFTPSDSDCPVSIVAPLSLVASATLALKAVVSSEKFGASVNTTHSRPWGSSLHAVGF